MGITLWWRHQASAWHACPWEHRPSSSELCAVLMRPSMISQNIKDEPCAKQRALFGVFSSRCSSVSRGHQIWCSLYFFSPLVPGMRVISLLGKFSNLQHDHNKSYCGSAWFMYAWGQRDVQGRRISVRARRRRKFRDLFLKTFFIG